MVEGSLAGDKGFGDNPRLSKSPICSSSEAPKKPGDRQAGQVITKKLTLKCRQKDELQKRKDRVEARTRMWSCEEAKEGVMIPSQD